MSDKKLIYKLTKVDGWCKLCDFSHSSTCHHPGGCSDGYAYKLDTEDPKPFRVVAWFKTKPENKFKYKFRTKEGCENQKIVMKRVRKNMLHYKIEVLANGNWYKIA